MSSGREPIKKILDKHITKDNYASIRKCKIIKNGRAIRFVIYDTAYDVPLSYLIDWFSKIDYLHKRNGGFVKKGDCHAKYTKVSLMINCRRIKHNYAARIYFDNLTAVDVVWDTILMACENRYEHFGGLTEKSKQITSNGFQKVKKYQAGSLG